MAEDRAGAGREEGRKRIERLMRQHGIQGRRLQRRHRTTIPDPAAQAVPDLLRRNFTASAADRAWVGDITYLPIASGKFLYLATVIDVFSRRLLGWSMADHMRAELVTNALNAAVRTRGGQVDGVIFHSDHGAQGGSKAFADACHQAGILRSMGAVGTSADKPLSSHCTSSPIGFALRTEINYAGHRCMTTGVHDQGGSPRSFTLPCRTARHLKPNPTHPMSYTSMPSACAVNAFHERRVNEVPQFSRVGPTADG
ncbi:DDE-type integrase/transposase/recombinase [Streptomyces sp. NPDC001127]|uniref:DDE-type integrase/transposase/recombinase n=1 Tax=Streptomyces sp. NPDC001127 TaxID=3154377 RepID=UPI00332D8833